MSSNIFEIADLIAADPVLAMWYPEVTATPSYEFTEIARNHQCCIVPAGVEYSNVSRIQTEMTYRIEIGFMMQDSKMDLLEMIAEIQGIATAFLRKNYSDAVCISVAHEPIYSPEEWETKSMFLSVISLRLKVMRHG